jgi:hypothetical protein
MTDWTSKFDGYTLRARLYPAFLTIFPLSCTVSILWGKPSFEVLVPLAVSIGVIFFIGNFVRSRGQSLEERLVVRWDGLPTTRMLRYRETSNVGLLQRRRSQLERRFDISLPTRSQERRNPAGADDVYVMATRLLISYARERRSEYPLLHDENINYGFRRNLLAMKPVGVFLVLVSLAVQIFYWFTKGFDTRLLIAVGAVTGTLVAWLLVVRSSWVEQAGKTYAERLFETLENFPVPESGSKPPEEIGER